MEEVALSLPLHLSPAFSLSMSPHHRVCHPVSGRVLEVSTSQPGVQFYTANFLDGSLVGKGGASYRKHSAFCLETQNWPDAVNKVHQICIVIALFTSMSQMASHPSIELHSI